MMHLRPAQTTLRVNDVSKTSTQFHKIQEVIIAQSFVQEAIILNCTLQLFQDF